MPATCDVVVLLSGTGSNLQALIDSTRTGDSPVRIAAVISNRSDAYGLQRARDAGIDTRSLDHKAFEGREAFDSALIELIDAFNPKLVVLAGFMRILSADFTADFDRRIINVHPSLIPAFCGKGFYGLRVHQAALDYGVKVTGATVHFVNEVPDGGEIIAQKAVPVYPDDTPKTLQRRVMEEAEWVLLPRACEMISQSLNKGATVECL